MEGLDLNVLSFSIAVIIVAIMWGGLGIYMLYKFRNSICKMMAAGIWIFIMLCTIIVLTTNILYHLKK